MRDWMATVETHALHHRQRRRAAPVPDDGPRFPVGHRPARRRQQCLRADRPAARRGGRLRRRRQQLGRHVLPLRRRHARSNWSASRPAAAAPRPGEHAATLSHGQPGVLHGTLQLRPAGRRRPDRAGAFGLGRPRLSRRRPRAQLLEGQRPGALHQRRRRRGAARRFDLCSPAGRHPAGPGDGPRRRRGDAHRGRSGPRTTWWSSASPAAATRTASRWPSLQGEEIE